MQSNDPANFARKYFPSAVGALIGLLIMITIWPFYSVPTGSRGVVTQFGRIVSVENEGLAILPPWQKLTNFSIRAERADIEGAEGSTSDTQPVHISLTVRYSISVDKVSEVFEKYSHDGNLSSYVQTAAQETVKSVTAKYTAPDLIAKRAQVSHDLVAALRLKLAIYGASVINVDMKNFAFSKTYMDAINDKVTQEQKKLAAQNKVLTIEAEQHSKVVTANAERDAKKAAADGEAYALLKVATAQADALRVQNQALAQNRDVLELRRIEVEMQKAKSWDGTLPVNMYGSAPIPFLQLSK